MRSSVSLALLSLLVALAAGEAVAQAGLRVPERTEPGLDPSFARGWLAPEYDRFGFATYQWRDAVGFSPAPRMNWAYSFGARADVSLSYNNNYAGLAIGPTGRLYLGTTAGIVTLRDG